MTEISWLLLTYKVPSDPATKRVALWRKIKGLGAVYVQNGVCMLPKTDEHVRRFKMLENDIVEMGGEAVILETAAIDSGQQEKVIVRFKADRDEHYHEFLERCSDFEKEIAKETAAGKFSYAELEENDADLKKLQDWLEKIGKLDFYGAPLATEAQEQLKACETLLDTFAKQVFEAHEETRSSASKPVEETD
ncbi:chromate resistance protein ChrB [Rhizobium jaguaris]|uniref:Chromate resistance protein ChrB n=1 Tax=Rhizobium jaguaris TaxID=1312183 RepID=UPI0039BF3914